MPIPDVGGGRGWPPACGGPGHCGPTQVSRTQVPESGRESDTGNVSTEKLLFLFLVAFLVPYFTAPTSGILLLKHYEIPGPVLSVILRNSIFAEW